MVLVSGQVDRGEQAHGEHGDDAGDPQRPLLATATDQLGAPSHLGAVVLQRR
jgi:hypothetical protein